MALSLAQLRNEITTDPIGLGLPALKAAGDVPQLVEVLNLVRAGISVIREPISSSLLFSRLDPTEFGLLTALQLQQLQVILTVPLLDLADTSTRTILANIFTGKATTLANLAVLRNRQGSRVEQLGGTGTTVDIEQVSQAIGA